MVLDVGEIVKYGCCDDWANSSDLMLSLLTLLNDIHNNNDNLVW